MRRKPIRANEALTIENLELRENLRKMKVRYGSNGKSKLKCNVVISFLVLVIGLVNAVMGR